MKSIIFGIAGVVFQGIFLTAFVLISRMSIAPVGKPIVIGIALIGMAFLLWQGVKHVKTRAALYVLPALLALGYILAFHLVGMLGFPGLLRDLEFSADYFVFVLRVTLVVFVLYLIGTVALYLFEYKVLGSD